MHAYLVLVTRHRRKVLTASMIEYLSGIFGKVCEDFGAELTECDGDDDHLHLLIEYMPKISVSGLVNSLEGVSPRRLRRQYKLQTHCDHLWSPSYFAAPCGGAPLDIVRQYMENQQTPGG